MISTTQSICWDEWQQEALKHNGDLLLCTGRQVGKTQIMAVKAARLMLTNPGTRIIIVSLTEDQARLIIRMILIYLEQHDRKMIIISGKDKVTQNKITLRNKSTAIARPVGITGDSVRGFTGDVLIIDEASRMPERVFEAAEPTLLTTGGQIWMCSTPFGKKGYFYNSYLNKDNNWKVIHISSEEVIHNRPISPSWTEAQRENAIKRLEQQKRSRSKKEYGQEYLAMFVEDLQQYFSDELIAKCCVLKREQTEKLTGKKYMGVDIARMGEDESVFAILLDNNTKIYRQTENIITTKTLTTETEKRIIDLHGIHKFSKIGIDAGAGTLGVSILDHLLETELRNKVLALNNRAMSLDPDGRKKQRLLKEDLYNNLKTLMERGEIEFLEDDEIVLSLKSVQWEYIISAGKVSKLRIFGNYTHCVEALIRAAWLAKREKTLNLYAF